ncbi:MAG: methyl-accepting chemotaxis protein [Lentisphaerota bacterium]
MEWFINLSIRTKVLIGFGVMWIFLALVAVVAYRGLEEIRLSEQGLHAIQFKSALNIMQLRSHLNHQRSEILAMMVTPSKPDQDAFAESVTKRQEDMDALVKDVLKSDPDPKCQSLLKEYLAIEAVFRPAREQVKAFIQQGKIAEASQMALGIQAERFTKMRSILIELDDIQGEEVDRQLATDMREAKSSELLFVMCAIAALLFGAFMTVLMNKTIAQPLSGISSLATQVAGGDLSVTMAEDQRQDEVGTLGQAFLRMVENLRRSTADIKEAINLLGTTASQILASTTQVATGTAETATAISETTTTVEEVRQAAQLSSQKAKNVADSAQRVANVSQTGQKAVEETASVMRHIRDQMESIAQTIVRLSEQSQSIGGIIASVTDIADQSNLLAVNAAIEAARAGEQGKGFTVVAQEIKSLAEQSKQATMQVRSILSDVQKATSAAVMATEQGSKAVEAGVKQSAQAGEAIQVLAETSGEAVQAATQIVASSQQQVVGMDQIGTAMENINQAGAETAASTRQVETAAQNLHALGQKLKELVEQFKG